ncbi:MAG: efflux RND transporter periplasmic adaptor subunit [Desulfobacteraceae bacterium]|nr:MAG: efflux RND transporter periplasmic adaptor subunit [Desulfobacteraceae bacterium]
MKNKLMEDVGPSLARLGRAVLAMVFLITAGCSGDASENQAANSKRPVTAMPVTIAEALEKAVPIELQAVGTVDAFATVKVKAQVEGELTAVHLREGQCIRSGDLLFSIDKRPFEIQLKQMQANLARDQAQLDNARSVLGRNAAVVGKGYVSQEKYDQAVANVAALAATVRADEAAVENARIKLAYCSIHSPINGCAGEVHVDRGNLVKANDAENPLVVIRQIDPIHVCFHLPERYLADVKNYSAAGKLAVLATPAGGGREPLKGELTFVDNSVNTSTGTILLKATFANTSQALWPGQFVNVTLQLAMQAKAVAVPSQAVQTGQDGRYLFIFKPDQTVEFRPVTVDRSMNGETVIAAGVQAGEKVVTDGQLRLFQGAPVKIVGGPKEPGGSQP